jgi:hypothetical protein
LEYWGIEKLDCLTTGGTGEHRVLDFQLLNYDSLSMVDTPREIPFGFAQGRLSLRLKNGCARDDIDSDEEGRKQTATPFGAEDVVRIADRT